jgi:hypothetical protein
MYNVFPTLNDIRTKFVFSTDFSRITLLPSHAWQQELNTTHNHLKNCRLQCTKNYSYKEQVIFCAFSVAPQLTGSEGRLTSFHHVRKPNNMSVDSVSVRVRKVSWSLYFYKTGLIPSSFLTKLYRCSSYL